MRAQLQIVLGTQLTRGSNAPIPSWWPDDVRFTMTYGIPKMKEADVGKLYDAFGGFLVGSGQYGQQPTPQGDLIRARCYTMRPGPGGAPSQVLIQSVRSGKFET